MADSPASNAPKLRLKKDGTPAKRPGPKPGSPKQSGSGRKSKDWKQAVRERIWSYVDAGLAGEPVVQAGPTGKQIRAPLSQENQVRLLQTAWKKLEPDLNATAIKADVETHVQHHEPSEPRQLARVVANILNQAQIEEVVGEPIAEQAPPPPAQLLLGRDAIIEADYKPVTARQPLADSDLAGPLEGASDPSAGLASDAASETNCAVSEVSSPDAGFSWPATEAPDRAGPGVLGEGSVLTSPGPPSFPHPSKRPHGFKIECSTNGACGFWHAERKIWVIYDSRNVAHGAPAGVLRDDAKAMARLAELPRGDGHWQPNEFEQSMPQTCGQERRKDNGPIVPNKGPRVVRRQPR